MAKISNTGRRLTRPLLIKVLLVSGAVLALVLAACSAADRAGGTPAADSGAKGSLTGDTSGTPGAPPPEESSPGHDDRAVAARSYQWTGVVVESTLEARHFELSRECDSWVLLAQSDAAGQKIASNAGNRVVVWGTVFAGPTVYQRQAIAVQNVFGPGDPMPLTLVAVPDYPCPGKPVPPPAGSQIALLAGEAAARGTLRWEGGRPFLATPQGTVRLTLPASGDRAVSPAAPDAPGAGRAPSLDVVAAGAWSQDGGTLAIAGRTVQAWPVDVVVRTDTGAVVSAGALQPGELAAWGTLVADGSRLLLKTASGPIEVTLGTRQAPSVLPNEALVVGQWKVSASRLGVTARTVLPFSQRPPPEPARTLLPGEAAIVGTLAWENGQPLLDTPSGRVRLTLLAPVPPPLGGRAGDAAPPDGAPNARPASLQVVAVGKWRIEQGQLLLAVRYLVPAPSPIILEPGGGPPPVVTPPPEGAGALTGQVRIGPLCPVEPCRNPQPDVYSSRSLVLQPQAGEPVLVPLQPDGAFKAAVTPGVYQVTLTNCGFLGCKTALPKTVTIRAGQVTTLEITIDTGIR